MPSRAAPVASRRSSGATLPMPVCKEPLKPSHDNSNASSSQKSNSAVETLEDLLKPSIVVKPHPPKLSVQPRSLQPLMLLPREYLQLSYLDLSVPNGSFEYSRFFESSIKILDLEGRFGSRPVVLIARLESDKSIYALERQKGGLYTLCHIGSWVDLQDLEKVATVSLPQLVKKETTTSKDSRPPPVPPLTTPQLHHETKKRRLAIEALESIVKKPVRPRSASSTSQLLPVGPPTPGQPGTESQVESARILRDELPTGVLEAQRESQAAKAPEVDDLLNAPTAGVIFENIRNQYFESLYHSMGSLGYFAKGPLSRARAAFHLDCDSNLEMSDLIGFLRSLVMTTAQIDKKYRETIPGIIAKMKPMFEDSDAEQANAKTKKRKVKKMKLGKDGLYPMEDDRIRKWWDARKPQSKRDEDMTTTDTESHETKLQIAWLRSRETQLQMIIILEILALEPVVASRNEGDSQLPGLPGLEPTAEPPKETPPKKGKGRNNLPLLVDLHADRLCIWQSTSLDGVKFLAGQESQEQNTQKALDPLKDFCVDIIVPFFSARLPEQSDSISRKLGGPLMMPPPPKPKVKKPEPVPKPKPKPGSAAKRPGVSKSKSSGSLEKVLSRESEKHRRSMSRGPSGVIALMRSTTTPMLKREASEPLSLKSIPRADSAPLREKAPRPLTAAPPKRKTGEEKAKKEALVQAELQDAISALRRPNRDVVGKDMAEAAERRANTSLSQLKKARKPTQHTRPQDSIVKATPVGKRYKDVFGTSAGHRQTPRGLGAHEPSSTPFSLVPSSGAKKRTHESAFTLESSPSITRSEPFPQIKATPVKQSSLKQSFLSVPKHDDEDILASSPIMSRKSSSLSFHDSGIGFDELVETPVKPRAVPIPSDGIVAGTPTKRRILESTAANGSSSVSNTTAEPARKLSIYERLGWDDDLDELG
ncbi:DNA replication regulator SLD3-domain-containing protein [Annulohypoxylon truncatum]|uniref:DNA replication regulator SLD3-domain-containing protein n=1 Tax=Annulohypoxylon truncatum TaxID=327061 RepID=UPI002008CDD7|nr:DNA replication regulator SLD3-domain-containing protein [Annulohypoxylon truncatum]KAI1214152.1 DNA replication regulator SLD3-domain-containing protein [Annulohypoxylon truncatum]